MCKRKNKINKFARYYYFSIIYIYTNVNHSIYENTASKKIGYAYHKLNYCLKYSLNLPYKA